ncbi:putative flavin-containing monooxygenase [Zychaea mexicana]|uniref:putative flavin-containing monooxygenase n=1 Tax=Zychaea mexicana TaxID=64656 RepID=UPI0022FE3441|nr:putative flavin-containing monooxygenase [Zychaea mexicana]KAI9497767.1 putative flavin-containing monooxygenase [Zychaea mexicana]
MAPRNGNTRTAAVIGTGFSGIGAAIKLEKELGIQAQIFEMSDDVGGTWKANTYPGAECDIPSHLYSLSFDLNHTWTKHYSSQSEIHAYLQGVAKKYHLYERTRFHTEITRAEWIEHRQQWCLQWQSIIDREQKGSGYYDIVFAGLGPLRIPNIPDEFKGFQGTIVHTTHWDKSVDYNNKRIAVIGCGATAIQVIPELQKIASHIHSYQRTPAWVTPRDQFTYSRIVRIVFRWLPFLRKIYRFLLFLQHEMYYVYFGYYNSFFGRFVHRVFAKLVAWRLTRAGRPDLVPVLTPDYPPGCKRIAKSEVYLESLAKPNVTVNRSGIKNIKGRTLIDNDENETEVDILVLATGFNIQGVSGNLQIIGRNGTILNEKWSKEFPKTYKTVTIHGYPNFFMLLGPSTGLGHNSVVTMIEIQIDFAIKCLKHVVRKDLAAIEPKISAQEAFDNKLQKSFDGTVWKGGCRSWYMTYTGEVAGLWSGPITSFWWSLRKADVRDFIMYKKATPITM